MTSGRDRLYAETLGDPGLFSFNDAVVGVFPDMIRRSVPGYSTVIAMTGLLASRHARPGSHVYDIGCSLGASLVAVAERVDTQSVSLVGIDNSPAMIKQCRQTLDTALPDNSVQLVESNATGFPYVDASVCILNYTLQFVPVASRLSLLTTLRESMQTGDILILSEKIRLDTPEMDRHMIELHHDFKRAQGYSDLEIAAKRQALENVLIPETRQTHVERLRSAGFSDCEFWFQCFNFASLVAIA